MHGLIGCATGAIASPGLLYDIAQVCPTTAEPVGSLGDPYLADDLHWYGDVALASMDVIDDLNAVYLRGPDMTDQVQILQHRMGMTSFSRSSWGC